MKYQDLVPRKHIYIHLYAPSNAAKTISAMYRQINIEKATFTPLVFSTSGGMGPEAMLLYKRILCLLRRPSPG